MGIIGVVSSAIDPEARAAGRPDRTAAVLASVLTFDAPEHVERCIRMLDEQTVRPARISVVDNHGPLAIDPHRISELTDIPTAVLRLPENLGPAGGHHAGIAELATTGLEYAWVMDDDVQPDPDCLEGLLSSMHAAGNRAVVGPAIIDSESGERCDGWGWWGVLFSREAVETAGLPDPDLFWGLEDQEYLRDRLPQRGFEPVRSDVAVVRLSRRPDWRADTRIEGVAFQHDKPAWKYYYELRNLTHRYLRDRPHIRFSVRAKSLLRYYAAYASMLRSETEGRGTKAGHAARGLLDGALGRLGKRVDPTDSDRPPA